MPAPEPVGYNDNYFNPNRAGSGVVSTIMNFHIAQLNIARAKAEMDTALMQGFVSRLDEINALADNAPGFVWRLQTEDGDATALRVFDDPLTLVNLSVWTSPERLKEFVYRSSHVELIQDREAWFDKLGSLHQVLWWIPQGHIPTIEEAKEKLDFIREHGPSEQAFSFGKTFSHP
jgi:hypothetical protein